MRQIGIAKMNGYPFGRTSKDIILDVGSDLRQAYSDHMKHACSTVFKSNRIQKCHLLCGLL